MQRKVAIPHIFKTIQITNYLIRCRTLHICNKISCKRGDVVNKLRKGLPKLWRSVGLTQDFIRREVVKGRKEDVKYQKCDLIKPHTARRSFAMIKTYEDNWAEWKVMRYTGHQNSNNFKTYLNCTA